MNLWEEGNHAVTYTNLSILRVKEESSTSTSWDSFTYKILWYNLNFNTKYWVKTQNRRKKLFRLSG